MVLRVIPTQRQEEQGMSRESWVTRTGEIRTKETLAGHLFSMRAAAVYDLFGQILLQEFFKGIRTGEKDPATLIASLPGVTLSLADFINQLTTSHSRTMLALFRRGAAPASTAIRSSVREGFIGRAGARSGCFSLASEGFTGFQASASPASPPRPLPCWPASKVTRGVAPQA